MSISGNEAARPQLSNGLLKSNIGLTIRQEFSARFMAALLSVDGIHQYGFDPIAADAVNAADALINALNKSEK